ncbi:MAG: hypothetical protein ACK5LV_00755 [Lachnospirales bacterium]
MNELLDLLQNNEVVKKALGDIDLSNIDADTIQQVVSKLKDFQGTAEENDAVSEILEKVTSLAGGEGMADLAKDVLEEKGKGLLGKFFKK